MQRAIIAVIVYAFAGFLLFITRGTGGGLDTAAVALAGPLVTAVTVFYFHSEAVAAGAAISQAGTAAGAKAALGQPATPPTSTTTTTSTTGGAS